jgi:hypothetical protein
VSALVVIVFVVLLVVGSAGLTYLIRYVGRERQVTYDQDVAQFVAGTQPDPAFVQRQAEIEQNLADADALEAQVEAETPVTPTPPPPVQPPATPDPEPDPTI